MKTPEELMAELNTLRAKKEREREEQFNDDNIAYIWDKYYCR